MNRVPQVQVANIGNALARGMQLGQSASQMRNQNKLAQALPQAVQGDENALRQVMQLDPTTGMQVQSHAAQQQQQRLEQAQQEGMYVVQGLSALPEPQRAEMYPQATATFRQRFPELGQVIPEQYDPKWFRMVQSRFLPGAGEALTDQAFPKPEKPQADPTSIREYNLAKSQGFKGSFMDFKAAQKGNGMTVYGPDGKPIVTTGNPSNIKLTEQQSKDVVYYERGSQALETLDSVDSEALTQFMGATLGQIPVVGNYLKSDEYRQAEQPAQNFLAAILRKDTGAAVTKNEFKMYGGIFLPTPGDDDGTLRQKSEARKVALGAIRKGLGTAEAIFQGQQVLMADPPKATDPGDQIDDLVNKYAGQ